MSELAAYSLAVDGPYRPHAYVGMLGDGSTGVMRLQFTEPATAAEVAYVKSIAEANVPMWLVIEPVWTPQVLP